MEIAIPDTSCLIALERIDRLALLRFSFRSVVVPDEVGMEFGRQVDWIEQRSVNDLKLLGALQQFLGKGEAVAITLAAETPDAVLIVDDLKARKIASKIGIRLMGTVGLAVTAKRTGLLERVFPVLEELQGVDFRIDENLFNHALKISGESRSDSIS